MEIRANNVNGAYTEAMRYLLAEGIPEESRNGKVIVAPEPVLTTYYRPKERVLFSPERDANPYFHLMECLWMLAGRNDAEFLVHYNKRMSMFANDDGTFDGAYGYRWRFHFGLNQLDAVTRTLQAEPNSRRAVLTMFDPTYDLGVASKDIPCNTHIYFDLRYGVLNMTVCNRSNDAVWGCYGANAVHMSFLQEVIAGVLKAPVGDYRQFSNNLHFYPDAPRMEVILSKPESNDLYMTNPWSPYPIMDDPLPWFLDLGRFMRGHYEGFRTTWFNEVAVPMQASWEAHKAKLHAGAIHHAQQIQDPAWSYACVAWLERRF